MTLVNKVRKWVFLLVALLLLVSPIIGGCGGNGGSAYSLSISVSPSGGGTTSPALGTYKYEEGEVVTVTATPANGYQFVNWTGDASSTTATLALLIDKKKSIKANFVKIPYTLTLAVSGNGTTTPAVGDHTYDAGKTVTIKAKPASGWRFDHWDGDVADPAAATTTVTLDNYKTVTANFAELVTYTLTMEIDGEGTTTPAEGDHTYDPEKVVTITAKPATGWRFDRWDGDVADPHGATTTVTMDDDKTVMAWFAQLVTYTLTMEVDGEGTTTPAVGDHTYDPEKVVTITAKPATGWRFDYWEGDVADPDSATTTVIMDDDQTVTAYFWELAEYTLTMEVDGEGSTSPSVGDHTYLEGTVVNIRATAGSGWEFDMWIGDTATVDDVTEARTTIIMDDDYCITASFSEL
jgi:hypothetical protein